MIGILIIAHGGFGESLVSCAKHVLGHQPPQIDVLAVSGQDNLQTVLPKARQLVATLNTGDGVLVLSDIYGATPCNIVSQLVQPETVAGVAGVNLPMLLRTITYRDQKLAVLVEKAVSGGREGVVHFNQQACERYESN